MAEKIGVKHIYTPKNAFLSIMFELYAQIDQGNLQEQSFLDNRFWLKIAPSWPRKRNGHTSHTQKRLFIAIVCVTSSDYIYYQSLLINTLIMQLLVDFYGVHLLRNKVLYFPPIGVFRYLHNRDKVFDLNLQMSSL